MARLFKMVLVEDIPEYEAQGWKVSTGRNINLGGWPSVWIRRNKIFPSFPCK